MSKTYTKEEFDKALSKGIASATGRREEQFNKMIKDLGFDSVEEVKLIRGERDQFKVDFENLQNETTIKSKKSEIKALGVDDTFVDYILGAVEDGNYSDFVEKNPKFKAETFGKVSSSPQIGGKAPDAEVALRKAAGLPVEK